MKCNTLPTFLNERITTVLEYAQGSAQGIVGRKQNRQTVASHQQRERVQLRLHYKRSLT